MEKITYASLGSLGEEFHLKFDSALKNVRGNFGRNYPIYIGGKAQKAKTTFADISPSDVRNVLGKFQLASSSSTQQAINAAKESFPIWRDLGWRRRIDLMRKAARLMAQRQYEFAALLTLEVGKNRFEAIAEVSEAIDLILYYCQQMEEHNGYEIPLVNKGKERTKSILKPYGVWAVVAPFNFPLALGTGMAAGALIAGNTVVFKPASDTPFSGICLYEVLRDAGLPPGVFNLLTGRGEIIGNELITNVDGFIFTGSKPVGLAVLQKFGNKIPKPCITEMGGKNPALIMPTANLDDGAEGVVRSAFGMGGQKCSACSRVYIHKNIYKPFVDLLVEKTKSRKVGDPADRDVFLGPLINEAAVKKYERAVSLGKREGKIVCGGKILQKDDFAHGYFVEPTIVNQLPRNSRMFQEEFFAPVLSLAQVSSLDEAITLANRSEFGLTAGIFSQDPEEQQTFFNQIEAGVTYCNRRGGATTGAWPGIQSFGGWKCSGSSGKSALGPHYVAQFMREQSQTIIENRGK